MISGTVVRGILCRWLWQTKSKAGVEEHANKSLLDCVQFALCGFTLVGLLEEGSVAYSRKSLNSVGEALLLLIDVLDFGFVVALFGGEFIFVGALSLLVFRDFGSEGTHSFSEFRFKAFHSLIEFSVHVVDLVLQVMLSGLAFELLRDRLVVLGLEVGDLDFVRLLSGIPFGLSFTGPFVVPLAHCDVEYLVGKFIVEPRESELCQS